MYFKNEPKYSNIHVTDDVMSLFDNEKNCQVEHYFPANFLCRVMKRQLSNSPRPSFPTFSFAHVHYPLKF